MRDTGATAVMHFAAWLAVADSVRDPVGYYRNNVRRARSATLEAMAAEGCRRFVFSSTCAVYGEPVETPISETHPTAPINAYGQTKLAIEHALPHFERAYGIRSIRLRYFNAAGADPDGELGEDHAPEIHVIPRAIRGGQPAVPPIEIFGEDYPTPDGTCLRDYIHVTDLADAHVRALRRLEAGGASATYNVGTERPSSVRDVIAAVERVTGRTVVRRSAPRRPAIRRCSTRRPQRIREELGWVPARPISTRSSPTPGDGIRRIRAASIGPGSALMSRLRGVLADPLLSVVMPAFNEMDDDRGDHPARARGAAAHRSSIVVDDCSTRRHARAADQAADASSGSRCCCSSATRARARRSAAASRR